MPLLFYPNQHKDTDYTSVNILVFKTNLNGSDDVLKVRDALNNDAAVLSWSVDTNDIDKVLRIESLSQHTQSIVDMIHAAGYQCEELPD